MKYFTKEVQIALVAIAGVAVLFFGLQFLKGLSIFGSSDTYYLKTDNLMGVTASTPVYADGYKVGVVGSINYDYDANGNTVVALALDKGMRLPSGSVAEISSDMMGNVKLDILLANNPRERMAVGDTLQGVANAGLMSAVGSMVPQLQAMMPKLDSILTSINALLANPAIANSINNMETITAELTETSRQCNVMMRGLNKNIPALMAKTNRVMDNAETFTGKLNELDVASTMSKVDATLCNVEQMTAKLNSNEGTIGLLMRDASLYWNLSNTMRDVDSLMIDLKAHPKRYVHFSIFGRKDK